MVQFMPVIPRPYQAGPPVRGDRFYGRARLLAEIIDGGDHTIWLVGNRRIGKTSALLQLEEIANQQGWITFNVAIDAAESLVRMSEIFLENLDDNDTRLQRLGLTLGNLEGMSPREIIRALNRAATKQGQRVLLLLDEVEALINVAKVEGDQILKDLQHVIEHSASLRVIMAASKRLLELDEICKGWETSRFLDPVVPKYMGSLEHDEALALLRQSQAASPQPIDDAVAAAILSATSGHPYLTQWLAASLWSDGVVRMPTAEDLLPAADAQLARMFQQDYDTLSDNERRILKALADAETLSAAQIGELLGPAAKPEMIKALLTGLAQLCCVCRAGDQYQIGNTLLRNWLRSELVHEPESAVSDDIAADMYDEEQQRITALIAEHERRLFLLNKQQALQGISTPPEITIEIEQIDAQIADLRCQLGRLRRR